MESHLRNRVVLESVGATYFYDEYIHKESIEDWEMEFYEKYCTSEELVELKSVIK